MSSARGYTNWLRTLGAPEDPTATDTTSAWSALSLLKAIFSRMQSLVYLENLIVAASDETTVLSTGTAKVTFRMPYALVLTAVRASLAVAQTSGSIFTVNIKKNGSTILSTKITIDNTEKTSVTAATPAVISSPSLADDDEMTIDIDQIGDGTAKGLKVAFIGHP